MITDRLGQDPEPVGVISVRNIIDTAAREYESVRSDLTAARRLGTVEMWIAVGGIIALLAWLNRKG